jgi:hypothetical protein
MHLPPETARDRLLEHPSVPAYEALSYLCMRPSATGVLGLKLLVYEAFSY